MKSWYKSPPYISFFLDISFTQMYVTIQKEKKSLLLLFHHNFKNTYSLFSFIQSSCFSVEKHRIYAHIAQILIFYFCGQRCWVHVYLDHLINFTWALEAHFPAPLLNKNCICVTFITIIQIRTQWRLRWRICLIECHYIECHCKSASMSCSLHSVCMCKTFCKTLNSLH